jgi:hypothetical protein
MRGCLAREEVLAVVEGGGEPEAKHHLEGCAKCREFHAALKKDIEALEISISLVWEEERVSCPHRDVLRAYAGGSLPKPAADYIRFHVHDVGCAYCLANLEDLETIDSSDQGRYVRSVHDRVMSSTLAFLGRKK